ncbi:MAG: FAD-dependent oxidoreductase, partial [Mogibacterium sp.]|nr:FAD-dependent oxidoreductase [Mogibacterium sp.]
MKPYDVAIIGGGVLGCFAARSMMQYRLSVVLIEGAEDVCTGITRTNTAVVYSGYDHHPGSLKADLTARANASFDTLCRELDVPFSRCGSLMTACGPRGEKILRRKLENGRQIGIPDLRLLTGDEARGLEPMLSPDVTLALYSGTTGTVNPWQLGIAAYENALANGLVSRLGAKAVSIMKDDSGYRIRTEREEISASAVINCAGTGAVQVQQMLYPSPVQLRLDGSDFLVFDPRTPHPSHIILEETESGKGITAVPCI